MRKSRYSKEQIIRVLRQVEAGQKVKDVITARRPCNHVETRILNARKWGAGQTTPRLWFGQR